MTHFHSSLRTSCDDDAFTPVGHSQSESAVVFACNELDRLRDVFADLVDAPSALRVRHAEVTLPNTSAFHIDFKLTRGGKDVASVCLPYKKAASGHIHASPAILRHAGSVDSIAPQKLIEVLRHLP